jgi:hypothetical protein
MKSHMKPNTGWQLCYFYVILGTNKTKHSNDLTQEPCRGGKHTADEDILFFLND